MGKGDNENVIIVGSLNDQELKSSITALVDYVEKGTKQIAASFDTTIDGMKRKLQEFNSLKSGGSSSETSSRTSAVEKETRARKENIATIDQEAAALQKAMQPKSAQDSYYVIVKNMRENLALLAMEIKSMPSLSLDKQFATYMQYERQIEQVRSRIAELRQELNKVGSDPSGSRLVIKQITDEIQQSQQRIVQIEREQIAATQQIANADKQALQAKQEQYQREKQALLDMSVGQRERATFTERQATQEARITDEIKQQAQAIRESKSWKEKGTSSFFLRDEATGKSSMFIISAKSELSVEQQILQALASHEAYKNKIIGLNLIEAQESKKVELSLATQLEAEKQITAEQEKRKKYKTPTTGINESFNRMLANTLGLSEGEIVRTTTQITKLESHLKQLKSAYDRLNQSERSSNFGKQLREEIQLTQRSIQKLRAEENRPINLNSILGTPPKTLDDIAYKIQQLQSYKRGLDITDPKQVNEMKTVDNEINKLNRDLQKYMETTKQATSINNALSRSWNYMKNRLAFYFTVGASTQFVKNLIDIRSQYEMNERALGILINSAERGTQIFNELSQMALVSPYTLIELSAAAKQLTAYDVAARDVVDTTRRLADMASAVGIPIERLTYALGQIKAYGYLNSRDNRMFANAGIPLVKQLADYYTELEGKMVSTADVYDRIKKKAVGYGDVMQVINKMTDEGGKFFDFQAKMADTLKVRLANLTLAWNNMLNDIGKESQGVLTWTIGALRQLFLHWKAIDKAIKDAAIAGGITIAARALNVILVKLGFQWRILSKEMTAAGIAGAGVAGKMSLLGRSLSTLMKNKLTWWSLLAFYIVEVGHGIYSAYEAQREFNKSVRDGAKDNYDNLTKFLDQYKKVRNELYETAKTKSPLGNIYSPNGEVASPTSNTLVARDIDNSEAAKVWEAMREQIELTTKASNAYIGQLLQIDNMSERLRQGFVILDDIQAVNAALKDIDDNTIKITKDLSSWWNAWALPDGLITNLKEYKDELNKIIEKYGSLENFRKNTFLGGKGTEDINDYEQALERFRDDLETTTNSILDFINLKGWEGDENKINEAFSQIVNKIVSDNQLSPKDAFELQLGVEEARSQAAKQALKARIEDEKAALQTYYSEEVAESLKADQERLANWAKFNGENRVYWDNFTKYIKERHISELQAAYNKMTENGTKSLDFQSQEWQNFVRNWANKFEKENGYAQDSVFNRLRNWVNDANSWSIFLKLTISTEDGKSLYETLTEADSAADEAYKKLERLKKRRDELKAQGGDTLVADAKVRDDYQKSLDEIIIAQKDYDDAIAKGGHSQKEDTANKKENAKANREATKAQREAETELQRALKDELSLIDKVRSQYKKLTDAGVSSNAAITMVTRQFNNSIEHINKILGKNGLPLFNIRTFAGTDNPREILNMLKAQLDAAKLAKNIKPSEIKDLEVKYGEIVIDAKTYDTKKITDGLNNELGKIKDEYELAVELDASPELGGLFESMLGIDIEELPRSFGEAFSKANDIAKKKLEELKVDASHFDLMQTVIRPDKENMWMGLSFDSDVVKNLLKWQKTFRDMFQKNLADTEKMLDDYVKKYGDYSDKIAEIEADKLNRIKKLNEAYYTEEMRRRPEYLAKLNAIEKGAEREKGQIKFDEFKNSRLYIAMFENLQYASTVTLNTIREKLEGLKSEMGSLSPEQLKQVQEQFEKIDNELLRRNPFKGLIKNAKNYIKTLGKQGKVTQKEFKAAQENYDNQLKIVTAKKEELEQVKAQQPWNKNAILAAAVQVSLEDEKLKKLAEELEKAEALNDEYNLMRKIFGDQAKALANLFQTIASNLQSLGELRDELKESFNLELGDTIDAVVDDLQKVGDGINAIISSAQSGNVVGIVTGVVKTVSGIGDAIASVFGDGSARTRRINREINKSKESVRQLELAYKDLERAVDKSLGSAETAARRSAIANKESELAELELQMALEQSKRSKDRDDDAIKEYEETIQDLRSEIQDLKDDVINNLLGSDVKSAAEEFVDTWVEAWRAGETTLDAIDEKMDEMIFNLIKKAATSKIVSTLLDPLYKAVDDYTKQGSEGGYDLTTNELKALASLGGELGIKINEALGAFYGNLESLNIITKDINGGEQELSALQAGIQGITEDTAGALEAYMNSVSQQSYLQSDLLTQIRDTVQSFDMDVQLATISQILLQLQGSYQVQMSIQGILEGWSNASGQAIRVELNS